ncbi:MAG TPA: hypothetical protein DCL44_12300 [Elusimicrobia bacterium]|nr:hypothetical protein [Elusimicrobiota bacterium]
MKTMTKTTSHKSQSSGGAVSNGLWPTNGQVTGHKSQDLKHNNSSRIKTVLLPVLAALMTACATPRVALNPRADFTSINRVAVMTFTGNKGDVAADLMTQSLVGSGANVVERQQLSAIMNEQQLSTSGQLDPATVKRLGRLLGVDAIFMGTVADSSPASNYIVNSSQETVLKNVTQVSGGNIYSNGSVPGLADSQLLSTTASVSLVSRMVEVETGSIFWSGYMSYEGFDLPSAMSSITDAFARSLSPIWPALTIKR